MDITKQRIVFIDSINLTEEEKNSGLFSYALVRKDPRTGLLYIKDFDPSIQALEGNFQGLRSSVNSNSQLIQGLDSRVETLEGQESADLPNIIFHIKDLSAPTENEKITIANIVKSVTNDFKEDVNLSAYSDVLLFNNKGASGQPDIRVYSLSSYEHKILDPTYYKFTFNLDDNVEYELIVYTDYIVETRMLEFVKKEDLDKVSGYPIDIDTEEKMNACLITANVGKIYRYVGTTGTYVNGFLYQVVKGG